MQRKIFIILLFITIFLVSCTSSSNSTSVEIATNTQQPTATETNLPPIATFTPDPTQTPVPVDFEYTVNFEPYENQFPLKPLDGGGYLLRCVVDTAVLEQIIKKAGNVESRLQAKCFFTLPNGQKAYIGNLMMYGYNSQTNELVFSLAGGVDNYPGNEIPYTDKGVAYAQGKILKIVTGSETPVQIIIGVVFGGNKQKPEVFKFMTPIRNASDEEALKKFAETGDTSSLDPNALFPYDAILTDTARK